MRRAARSRWLFWILTLPVFACSRKPAPPKPALAAAPAVPSYEMRLGKETYGHYCQSCHGETGAGDGFNAFNLDPRPRDFSDVLFQKKKNDADLADAIRRGGSGVGLSPLMPPWGHTLSARQIDDVILYVRALRKAPEPPPPAAAVPAAAATPGAR
jgi:mono/diheme cytochrome c family protein